MPLSLILMLMLNLIYFLISFYLSQLNVILFIIFNIIIIFINHYYHHYYFIIIIINIIIIFKEYDIKREEQKQKLEKYLERDIIGSCKQFLKGLIKEMNDEIKLINEK